MLGLLLILVLVVWIILIGNLLIGKNEISRKSLYLTFIIPAVVLLIIGANL